MEAVIPAEIGLPSPRVINYVSADNQEAVLSSLDLLEERRAKAFIREAKYKESMAKYYNERVKVND